jgi:hypothetical protein
VGNDDMVDNVQLSAVIVSDILDSHHLPVIFHILNHGRTRNLSDMVDIFTDWEQFQSLVSDLISPRLQINLDGKADKVACNFTASVASAYKLSTSRLTLLDLNKDLPGLEC